MTNELPFELKLGIDRWLNDVLCDMRENTEDDEDAGYTNARCVAQAVLSVLDCHERKATKALNALIDEKGFHEAMDLVTNYIKKYV